MDDITKYKVEQLQELLDKHYDSQRILKAVREELLRRKKVFEAKEALDKINERRKRND